MIKYSYLKKINFLICGLVLFPSILFSQSEQRLPDGRAFRVDTEGHRVVDYIAELEETVRALTEKLSATEVSDNTPPAAVVACSCANEVQASEDLCEKRIQQAQASIAAAAPQPVKELPSCEGVIKATTISLQEQCDERLQRIEAGYAEESARASISSAALVKQEADNLTKERDELKAQLLGSKAEILTLKRELQIQSQPVREAIPAQRASPVQPSLIQPIVQENSALQSLKISTKTECSRVQKLISERDASFERGMVKGSPLSLRPQKAISSMGRTVDDLRVKLERASTFRQVGEISRELSEIKMVVNRDQALIERLKKAR